jgi:hypothetical protein
MELELTRMSGAWEAWCRLFKRTQFEREIIRARAKACGVKMGRPPNLTPHQIKEALRQRDNGEPMREIARSYNAVKPRFRG